MTDPRLLSELNRVKVLFQVTPIGCGLAGYTREQIAPMFFGAPPNCDFRDEHNRDWRPAKDTDDGE